LQGLPESFWFACLNFGSIPKGSKKTDKCNPVFCFEAYGFFARKKIFFLNRFLYRGKDGITADYPDSNRDKAAFVG